MSPIYEIRSECYEEFFKKIKTQLITNNNVKETIGILIDTPIEYNIVSEIPKQYNLTSGINYKLKQKVGNNLILLPKIYN